MQTVYENERLILRVLTTEDAQVALQFWGNEEVMKRAGGAIREDALFQVLAGYQKCHLEKELSVYGAVEKDTGELIGAAGFNIPNSLEKVELIYHFSQKSWGKGYATEAAGACVELAKQHPQVITI